MSATPQGSVQFSGGSRRGSRSRRNSGAGRKRAGKSGGAGKQGGASQTPKIWDGLNNDITPKPLSKSVHPLSTGATPLHALLAFDAALMLVSSSLIADVAAPRRSNAPVPESCVCRAARGGGGPPRVPCAKCAR